MKACICQIFFVLLQAFLKTTNTTYMKKSLFCLLALAAVLMTSCNKEEPDLRTVKVLNQQLVINSTIKDYYDISIVYTLPDTVELTEQLAFQPISESFFPEIYKQYKMVPEYGTLYGTDFLRETKNAGEGKCQLVFKRNNKAYDTEETYTLLLYNGYFAGEKTSYSMETNTMRQGNIDGFNVEGIVRAKVQLIEKDVHTFTFTNPQPTK